MDEEKRSKEIAKLQTNLSAIRQIAGWTAENLGNHIGVTKQTISNLENGKTLMTLTQYIAIRAVLDHEIQKRPKDNLLGKIVDVLLNKSDNLTEVQTNNLKILAASAKGGLAKPALLALCASILGGPVATGAVLVGSALPWLSKLFDDEKNDK